MDKVFSFTPNELVAWLMAFCAAIVSISAALAVIAKVINAARKPNEDQNARLAELEERVARYDELFRKDNDRLIAIEEGNRITQRALLALLDHGLDGNNVEQMQDAKNALQTHLIER